jgi:hypothetical protein
MTGWLIGQSVVGSIVWCATCLFGGLVVLVSRSVAGLELFGQSFGWLDVEWVGWLVGRMVVWWLELLVGG